MSQVTVGFLFNGTLVASSGASVAEALGALEEQYGPQVVIAFADHGERVGEHLRALEKDADPRLLAAAGAAPATAGQQDRGRGPAAAEQPPADQALAPDAPVDAGGDAGTASGEAGPGPVDVGSGATAADRGACVICSAAVPPGLADLAVERFGDVRCRTCGDW